MPDLSAFDNALKRGGNLEKDSIERSMFGVISMDFNFEFD